VTLPQAATVAPPAASPTQASLNSTALAGGTDLVHTLCPKCPPGLKTPEVLAAGAGGAALIGGGITAVVEAAKQAAYNKKHPHNKETLMQQAQKDIPLLRPKHHARGQQQTSRQWRSPGTRPPTPTTVPIAQLPATVLKKQVLKGATTLDVDSISGFQAGDTIKVGDEYNLIKGFGSIILDHPMNRAQPAGAKVQCVHQRHPSAMQVTAAPKAYHPLKAKASPNVVVRITPPPQMLRSGIDTSPSGVTAAPAGYGATMRILFYVGLAGLLICCCCLSAIACISMLSKRKQKPRRGSFYGEEDDEEYEDEYTDEEEQPIAYRPAPWNTQDHPRNPQAMYLQGY